MTTGTIFNIQRFCIHDGDGIRTSVFLKGCPLRCIWCHNPEGLSKEPVLSFSKDKCTSCGRCLEICPSRKEENGTVIFCRESCKACGGCENICFNGANELIGKAVSTEAVMEEVFRDRMFYEASGGGLTITGGEPSYQPEFTLELLKLSAESGISAAIETCGTGTRDFYKKANAAGAVFLFDIKCIDPHRHRMLTGADNSHIMSNLSFLMDNKADIIIRLPLVPSCNDSDEDILRLAEFLNENEGRYRYAEIMPYHSMGTAKADRIGRKAEYIHNNATKEDISRWLKLFAAQQTEIRISE